MTLYYLNSAGTNTAPYDTAAKGAATLDTLIAIPLVAADIIYMDKSHFETHALGKIWISGAGVNAPTPIYRVDTGASDAYTPATSSADAINFQTTTGSDDMEFRNFVVYGASLNMTATGSYLQTGSAGGGTYSFIDIYLLNQDGIQPFATSDDNAFLFKNCIFEGSSARFGINGPARGAILIFDHCTFLHSRDAGLIRSSGAFSHYIFRFCDFSSITTNPWELIDSSAIGDINIEVEVIGCKLPNVTIDWADAGFINDSQSVVVLASDKTTNAYPLYKENYRGVISEDASTYHDSGYVDTDGDTNLSHEIIPDSTANRVSSQSPIVGFDMVQYYNDTGTVTVTVEAIENYTSALQDDEAWMEVFYYDGTDVLVSMDSTQVIPAATPSNLTAGTGLANWTGEPASSRSVKFVSSSLTIGKAGLVYARIHLGKYESGKQFFYDPQMVIA